MTPQLRTMSVDKLVTLRGQVEAELNAKVVAQRRMLESELSKLAQFNGGSGRGVRRGVHGLRGKVEPKYRNPENPDETWAGHGLKPRWLTAALKTGHKVEDFSIAANESNSSAKKTRKIGRKVGK
jgi:DNA-binding protein H-NS